MGLSEGPDKGHAWIIAFTACVIAMILSGISKMVGILYVAVIDTYHVSRQEATLPFTFRKSLRCLAGPLVGVIGQRFGIRVCTLLGGVIASLGAGLAFLAPNVTWLTVAWGGVHGLGESFANTLFQVVVNQYFVKYRSTACGIAMSGACIGSVIFSFLIEALRDAYGLQGTFLILSGVVMHVIPCAILLQSPSWIRNGTDPPTEGSEKKSTEPRGCVVSGDYVKSNEQKRKSVVSLSPDLLLEKNEIMSVMNLPTKSHSSANLVECLEKKLEVQKGRDNLALVLAQETRVEKQPLEKRLSIQNKFSTSKESLNGRLSSSNLSLESSLKKPVEIVEKNATENKPQTIMDSLKNMARLYLNPVFLLVALTMCIYVLTFTPVMTTMVDYSKDKGLPETVGKYLVHAMAIGDVIGRVGLGWVTDKEFMTISQYLTLALVLQGTCIVLIPFTFNLASFLVLLGLYAMTAGSMSVRLPVIVLQHVKKDEQSVAVGSYGFASGLVPLGVPMLIGRFRDHFGSYNGMYYLLGSLSMVSGSIWLLEPVLTRLYNHLEERKEIKNKV